MAKAPQKRKAPQKPETLAPAPLGGDGATFQETFQGANTPASQHSQEGIKVRWAGGLADPSASSPGQEVYDAVTHVPPELPEDAPQEKDLKKSVLLPPWLDAEVKKAMKHSNLGFGALMRDLLIKHLHEYTGEENAEYLQVRLGPTFAPFLEATARAEGTVPSELARQIIQKYYSHWCRYMRDMVVPEWQTAAKLRGMNEDPPSLDTEEKG